MTARVLFAAGGTGGHVYPALAVAEALRERSPQARLEFVGGRRGIEGRLVPAAGFRLHRLPAAGLRGLGPWGALRFALSFPLAFVASLGLLLRLRPHVVLATGGYASAAPATAAALLRRPLWIQEQNSVPGSTNRMLSRWAERAYLAFGEAEGALRRAGSVHRLPNPVRADLRRTATQPASAEDYEAFGLSRGTLTLLLFGGSRGAATLARAFREAWPAVADERRWQALVQVAEGDLESTRAVVAAAPAGAPAVRVLPYIDRMDRAYRIADLVLCRAGALTLAELACLGKPSVLVPFPHATDDHQTRNAQAFVDGGAAVAIADEELDGKRLASLLTELADAPERRHAMGAAARRVGGDQDGAARLAEALLERAAERRAA